jgi:hypothetical protein
VRACRNTGQVQQVLLNLLLNAVEALGSVEAEARELLISAEQDRVNEYFGLISLSSAHIRRASSTWPRWPSAEASATREKSVSGTSTIRSPSRAAAVSYFPANRYAVPRK